MFGSGHTLASEDTLLGVTWAESSLVSFDPSAGVVIQQHAQLNPYEAFRAIAHDRNHDRLYVLSQSLRNLYSIDLSTLKSAHIGNLHVDMTNLSPPQFVDAVTLAYDPIFDTLYTIVGHWLSYPSGPIYSELFKVDPASGELDLVGSFNGPWITSLAFSEVDRQLYGLGVYGAGSWDSPHKTHVVRIDPEIATIETVFETPYHTMLGFAIKEPQTFFSWVNWTTHFYGETDLATETILPLGNADSVDVISAMLYKDFPLETQQTPIKPAPVSFVYGGVITMVWDPNGELGGRVMEGDRFSGQLSYDAAAPYQMPDPNYDDRYGITLKINGTKHRAKGLGAWVANNYYDGWDHTLTDNFELEAYTDQNSTISWILADSSAEALRNNNMLPTRFSLSGWDDNSFVVIGDDWDGPSYYIVGTVDHVTRRKSLKPLRESGKSFPIRR